MSRWKQQINLLPHIKNERVIYFRPPSPQTRILYRSLHRIFFVFLNFTPLLKTPSIVIVVPPPTKLLLWTMPYIFGPITNTDIWSISTPYNERIKSIWIPILLYIGQPFKFPIAHKKHVNCDPDTEVKSILTRAHLNRVNIVFAHKLQVNHDARTKTKAFISGP